MKKSKWMIAVISLLGAVSSSWATDEDTLNQPFVTVNGTVYSNAVAEVLTRDMVMNGVRPDTQLKSTVRATLIDQALISDAAIKEGLEKLPLVQASIQLARQAVLVKAWQENQLKGKQFSQAEMQKEYDRQVKMLGPKEYRVRHIFVQTEDTAKLLIEKIQSGAKLASLVKEYSQDAATRDKEGLTEWTPAGELAPELLNVVKSLKTGQMAPNAVQAGGGWHVIQLDGVREFTPPSMESVRPQIIQSLAKQYLQAQVIKLREHDKIK